jgi:hypothetical protein
MTWEEAWEIHKDAAAEAAHIRWMETKQSHGFADHPWRQKTGISERWVEVCQFCDKPSAKHHSDMIPFADLSPEIAAYDYETAIIGFKFGFEAGVASAARPC